MASTKGVAGLFALTASAAFLSIAGIFTAQGTVQNIQGTTSQLKDSLMNMANFQIISAHDPFAFSSNKSAEQYIETSDDSMAEYQTGPIRSDTRLERNGKEPEKDFRKPVWSNSSDYSIDSPTILVQLGGELANNLGHMARGFGLAWWLEREFGLNATVMLRHGVIHAKWTSAEGMRHTVFHTCKTSIFRPEILTVSLRSCSL